MAPAGPVIQTGVDQLIALIEKKGGITIPEAANLLGLPKVVVEEWVSFLEEEGVITVDYKFSKGKLELKKLSEHEMKRKSQEFVSKKEGFLRKLESTLSYIDKERDWLGRIKGEFEQLAQEVHKEVENIGEELRTLEKFERLKSELDKEIIIQEQGYRDTIKQINKELESKRKSYEGIIKRLQKEHISLDEERANAVSLLKEEDRLSEELKRVTKWIGEIHKNIEKEKHTITNAEKHMDELKACSDKISKEITEKEDEITTLISQSKAQESEIIRLQKGILAKYVRERKKIAEDTKFLGALKDRFKQAFVKKKEILDLFNNMERELNSLRGEFEVLIKKAKIIEFSKGSSDVEKHTKEIEKKYKEMEKRRKNFEKEALKLTSLLKQV